jgi:hypothetical protein
VKFSTAYSLIDKVARSRDYQSGMIYRGSLIHDEGYKAHFAKQTFELIDEVDAIYFSGDFPSIYFVTARDDSEKGTIKISHRKIWNQGRVPIFFFISPTELSIFSAFERPLGENNENTDSLLLSPEARFKIDVLETNKLLNDFNQSEIDSGHFWKTQIGSQIKAIKKVDTLLLENLKETKRTLLNLVEDHSKEMKSAIHDLLGRSLFTLYLEDRKIIDHRYYREIGIGSGFESFFEILNSRPRTYQLFDTLRKKFNGDLFKVTAKERTLINAPHLKCIKRCFYGDDIKTLQPTFWRMFDFGIIPIELLSAIYEQFMHDEDDEETATETGSYYTSRALVEFVLNETLPYPSKKDSEWNLKILDPACGSGIFLAESYRRLIERWQFSHNGKQPNVTELKKILKQNIFGVELNLDALKITAFSLYLTMLSYVTPEEARKNVKFPKLIRYKRKNEELYGSNLYEGDTFEVVGYEKRKYDLVVGNPPWKEGSLMPSLRAYCDEHELPQEAAIAFIHKMALQFKGANIALIVNAKILFNTGSKYKSFIRQLFTGNNFHSVVNLAAYRQAKKSNGLEIFSACGPAAILNFTAGTGNKIQPKVLYCTLRPSYQLANHFIIDGQDIKYLAVRDIVDSTSFALKTASFGTARDNVVIKLASSLPKLKELLVKPHWELGNGWQDSAPKDKLSEILSRMRLVHASKIQRYVTSESCSIENKETLYRRLGAIGAYNAPHILIKKGQSEREFCASYLHFDASFRDGVYGIHHKDEMILKALTGYLNSAFASYYLSLTSSSFLIEREQYMLKEVLGLPAPSFLTNRVKAEKISSLVDRMITQLNRDFREEQVISNLQADIDAAIADEFLGHEFGNYLVENVNDYSVDLFFNKEKSRALEAVNVQMLSKYAKVLCNSLSIHLPTSKTNFHASVYQVNLHSPLTVISIHFDNRKSDGTITTEKGNMMSTLNTINQLVLSEHSSSVWFRKVVMHYSANSLFIVKPNEKRFWTRAIALEDSDTIAMKLMNPPKKNP